MDQSLILAIDQGTTSSRAILFNKQGGIVFSKQKEFQQIFPQPGWVEHDPEEIWATQLSTIKDCLAFAKKNAFLIEAIGITNQRETSVIWNRRTGKPVNNAIVWQDRRTSEYCDELKQEGHTDFVHQKTGLLIDAYFSATKIKWILDKDPSFRTEAEAGNLAFGTIDSWILWKLTGGKIHATDPSNASRTMLYNIRDHKWDEELLNIFTIPQEILPEVRPSSAFYGQTDISLLSESIPIHALIGDQQSALFGQLCTEEGSSKNTYGTGCFLVLNTGKNLKYSRHQLLSTIAWQIGDEFTYALEGSVFIGGAIVEWLKDGIHIIQNTGQVSELARSVKDSGGIVVVPALTGLGAPYWDSNARGAIFGLSRGTTSAHLARASLESIAFQVHDIIKAMEKDTGTKIKELKVDGGATNNKILMQFQADILQKDVIKSANHEATALGAAFLAGLDCGYWSNLAELRNLVSNATIFNPQMDLNEVKSKLELWHKAVNKSLNWLA